MSQLELLEKALEPGASVHIERLYDGRFWVELLNGEDETFKTASGMTLVKALEELFS